MTKRILFSLLLAVLWVGPICAPAFADSITFTLSDPDQGTTEGGMITYSGTIAASASNSAPVFLYGDTFTFPGTLSLDDSPFLIDFPVSLDPGQSVTDELFTVTVPSGLASGTYSGSFLIYGGGNADADDLLGTVEFQATVGTLTAVAPEPTAWLLLATSSIGMLLFPRRSARQRRRIKCTKQSISTVGW